MVLEPYLLDAQLKVLDNNQVFDLECDHSFYLRLISRNDGELCEEFYMDSLFYTPHMF